MVASNVASPVVLPPLRESLFTRGFRRVFDFLAWAVLSLRYRVRVVGLEKLEGLEGPALILPNHPAYLDPALILMALGPTLRPRPMLFEGILPAPLLYPVVKYFNALRVPDLETASAKARERTREAIDEAARALRKGERILLWPAGRVQLGGGVERLGGTRAVTDLLREAPEAGVILVRTSGMWGSSWSYAPTGQKPSMGRRVLAGLGWLIANLFVFMPRRAVTMTVEVVDRQHLPELRREVINPWLEQWYNSEGPEPPKFVPYHFLFGARTFEFPRKESLGQADLTCVKPATKNGIAEMLAEKVHRPLTPDDLKPETTLDQLGLDSLDRMELTLTVEQRFGFSCDQAPTSVGELWALAQGLAEREGPKVAPLAWRNALKLNGIPEVMGATIAEAFVNRALAQPQAVAVADDTSGVLTYERLLVGARVMARRFKKLQAPNVGLMLPASVACDTAFLGLHLAGKLPVLLNWTTGPANLAHAVSTMNLTHVVTSRRFIDRLHLTIEGVQYLFLEDVKQGIGKLELLRTLLSVRWRPGAMRKHVRAFSPEKPAVILFTSGSEKSPKAVPLTHRNILTNIHRGAPFLGYRLEDSILGFLPPFHSFGMTVAMLMPILGGMRVVHHPDPTDAARLAAKIAAYRPTVLLGTPTFVSYILERAKPEELKSLRMIIVGSEKCPPAVRERCAELVPGAGILEGYGITECSPAVAANRIGANRPGSLGQPFPGVNVCVVDLETDQELPANQQGMLLVNGPTVFPGYLDHDGPSPFRERNGERWYVTGDLARIDEEGFIWFAGRLKRFLKAGGEMISLPALEEPITRIYPPTADGPRVAVEGVETRDGRRIVLFSTEPITLRDANAKLQEEGFRGVMRFDEVRVLEKIPILGTGKTDYKVLREMVVASGAA